MDWKLANTFWARKKIESKIQFFVLRNGKNVGTDRRKLQRSKAESLEGDLIFNVREGSLEIAKSYAIPFFSPLLKIYQKKKNNMKWNVRSSVSRLTDGSLKFSNQAR